MIQTNKRMFPEGGILLFYNPWDDLQQSVFPGYFNRLLCHNGSALRVYLHSKKHNLCNYH